MSQIRRVDVPGITGELILDEAVGGQFRHVISLSIPTGGQAETARVVEGAVLDVRFLSRTVNALPSSAVERATLSQQGGDLVVSLPVAREIRRVKLASPIDGDRVAAYRFDGSVVSEDPVVRRSHGSNGAQLNVTDSQVILRRRNGSDFALTQNEISEIQLRYRPTNPRLALRLAGSNSETPFPAKLDADGVPEFPSDASFAEEFATALTSVIDGLGSPLPDPLAVDLILLSDQPCRARVDRLNLSLELETTAMAEKAVLRFPGGQRQSDRVSLALPLGSDILGGILSVTVTGTAPEAQVQTEPASGELTASDQGVRISADRIIASRYAVASPFAVAAVEVVLCAPDGPAELSVDILSDENGEPGSVLGQSEPVNVATAAPKAVSFQLPPVALATGDVWIALRVKSGTAIAMLGQAGVLAQSTPAGYVAFGTDSGKGIALVLRPVAVAPSAPGALPNTGPRVTLGGTVLSGVAGQGTTEFDLAGLAGSVQSASEIVISSAVKSTVTLDPVRLRYALSS